MYNVCTQHVHVHVYDTSYKVYAGVTYMFQTYTVHVVKEVVSFWGLGELMAVVRTRTL